MVPLVSAACLPLKVDQSAALSAPRLLAEAVGTLRVMTGVEVSVATEEVRSVPVVPRVKAATLVTLPETGVVQARVPLPSVVLSTWPLVPRVVGRVRV